MPSKLKITYDDEKNRIAGYDVTVSSGESSIEYVYGGNGYDPDMVTGVKVDGTQLLNYTYDGLNRLKSRIVNGYTTEYTYLQGKTADRTTTLVQTVKNGNDVLSYTYDEWGKLLRNLKAVLLVEMVCHWLRFIKSKLRGIDDEEIVYFSDYCDCIVCNSWMSRKKR